MSRDKIIDNKNLNKLKRKISLRKVLQSNQTERNMLIKRISTIAAVLIIVFAAVFVPGKMMAKVREDSKIVMINFAKENLGGIDTVKGYIQALILRDEVYAKSLMKNPPEILTISNPHQSGYSIISDGKDEEGYYVEAEVYFQYTSTPYYSIERFKYYLSLNAIGYLIDNIKLINRTEVYFKNGFMYLKNNSGEKELFDEDSIPSEYYLKGKSQIQTLALNTVSNSIIFTSYDNETARVKVIEYNILSGEFKLLSRLEGMNNEKILGTSDLSLDSTGKYAAVNIYYSQGKNIRNTIVVYNLSNNQNINLCDIVKGDLDSLYINFFEDSRLIFTGVKGDKEVRYKYDMEKNEFASL